jgi:hypothetical protein
MAYNHAWQAVFRPGASDDFFAADRPVRFQASAQGFTPVNAWWLSELCRLIYRKDASEGVDRLGHASRNDFLARVGLLNGNFSAAPPLRAP